MSDDASRRLKIAILSRGFFSRAGGAENYSISLVETLATKHEIHVFTQHLDHNYPGVTYHLLPQCVKKPSWIDLLCFSIRTWVATRKGFDLVHSHENTWHGQVQTVHVRPVRVGLFVGKHGFRRYIRYIQIATSPRLWTYLVMEAIRLAPKRGKAVIACSESLRVELESAYPSLQGKVHLLPPGVRFPELTSDSEKTDLRNEMKLPIGVFLLLFVANDYIKKGIGPLLAALQKLPKNIVLCVVGNSAHVPQFSQAAEQMGVAQQVRFIGSVASVDRFYRCADALVHPTTEDTFSMVTLEALAHGLPVIVSGAVYCGISADLTDEIEALVLQDPRDVEEIANSIIRLTTDESLRLRLGSNGRNFAKKYSWSDLAKRQDELYQLVLNTKHGKLS